LAAIHLKLRNLDATMAIFTADGFITEVERFCQAVVISIEIGWTDIGRWGPLAGIITRESG